LPGAWGWNVTRSLLTLIDCSLENPRGLMHKSIPPDFVAPETCASRRRCLGITVAALASLLACSRQPGAASRTPPAGGGKERTRALQMNALAPARAQLRRALSAPGQQVLALSGGGQWGAFGAGFLKGWTKSGDRPQVFQVVTGTSTGSLISTFAFLGPDYDDAVGRAYLEIRGDDDVMEKRFLLSALFKDSMATTKGLRRLIERNVTQDMLTKVASEAAKGRRLYVGAVDLDSGVFKPFDLTEIASRGGPTAREDFIDALMASTAIPVAFPPVVIAGRTYIDGGVRRNVFLELLVNELAQIRRDRGLTAAPEATVYCLVNGSLDVGEQPVKRKVLPIAKRTVDVLLDESTDGNLLRIYIRAQRAPLRFLMTHVPTGMCNAVGSEENRFDPDLMKCLYEQAQEFALGGHAWTAEPPLAEAEP
jgi:predicted acylesterase/phospholipase RssA